MVIRPDVTTSARRPPRWTSGRSAPLRAIRSRWAHGSHSRCPTHSTPPMRKCTRPARLGRSRASRCCGGRPRRGSPRTRRPGRRSRPARSASGRALVRVGLRTFLRLRNSGRPTRPRPASASASDTLRMAPSASAATRIDTTVPGVSALAVSRPVSANVCRSDHMPWPTCSNRAVGNGAHAIPGGEPNATAARASRESAAGSTAIQGPAHAKLAGSATGTRPKWRWLSQLRHTVHGSGGQRAGAEPM